MATLYPVTAANAVTAIRTILNEPTAQFWTDAELTDWISEATVRVSAAMLCYEVVDYITLATGQPWYGTLGSGGIVSDLVKVETCLYASAYGMQKIRPVMVSHLPSTAGSTILTTKPMYWYQFAGKLGVFPVPVASVTGKKVNVFGYKATDTFTNIPEHLQPIIIDLATSRALYKDKKFSAGAQFQAQAVALMNYHRRDLYSQPPESKDSIVMPDRSVPVQSGQ
jgi:hypothetical protein